MRLKQPDFLKRWTKYTAGVCAVTVLTTWASLGFDAPEVHAQSNITVKKVLERDVNGGATSIVTNGDIYLYSTDLGRSYISEDGLHWAQTDSDIKVGAESEMVSASGAKIIWDGKQFVTFTSDVLATSTDGVNWSGTRFEFEAIWDGGKVVFRNIFRDSEKYIALTQPVFQKGSGLSSILRMPYSFYYSYDLKTWHQGTTQWASNPLANVNTPSIKNMAWNGSDIYLAGGDQQLYSKDGIHWEGNMGRGDDETEGAQRNGSGDNGEQYIWDGNKFWLASGQNIKSSTDGADWDVAFTVDDGSVNLDAIGYNGRAYLAAGSSQEGFVFYYSLDGRSWEQVKIEDDGADQIQQVLPVNGGFLVAGQDIYWVSDTDWNTPSSWAAKDIGNAEQNQLVKADLLRAYRTPITRSEFSKTAVRLYEALTAQKSQPASNNPFVDTARPDVLKAYALGIAQGGEEGLFKPDEPITRQELAVMFYRTIQAAGVKLASVSEWQKAYSDIGDVSSYAEDALRYFNKANIVTGKDNNRLAPLDDTSREEAFVLAQRIYEKYQTGKVPAPGPTSGFESIKGLLEKEGYIVLEQKETSINGSPLSQSYVVQDKDSRTVLSYNKIAPEYKYAEGLFRKLFIDGYKVDADDDVLELSKQIIEREKGVPIPELSEFLKKAGIEAAENGRNKTYLRVERDPNIVVKFIAYRGGRNNLIIEIDY